MLDLYWEKLSWPPSLSTQFQDLKLAVEIADIVATEKDLKLEGVTYYSDSKVLLGYDWVVMKPGTFIFRLATGCYGSKNLQTQTLWHFVPTDLNPADHTTHSGHLRHQLAEWTQIPVQTRAQPL